METKHTPGPWIYDSESFFADINGALGHPIRTKDKTTNIAFVVSGDDAPELFSEAAANARLIASAPDLLRERDTLKHELSIMELRIDDLCNTIDSWRAGSERHERERDELKTTNAAIRVSLNNALEREIKATDKVIALQSLNAELLEVLKLAYSIIPAPGTLAPQSDNEQFNNKRLIIGKAITKAEGNN